MNVVPVSKPIRNHDENKDDDRTYWRCTDCGQRVDPEHVCKETK